VIFSIEESIQKLKIEILSQDWSLSQKKIEPLEAAFTCLKNRFKTRKSALAILTMADSVLQFAKKRDTPAPPEFIDFLKETMAHVVNMYEESKFDPDRDEELFKRVYAKFVRLRERVREERNALSDPAPEQAPVRGAARPAAPPVAPTRPARKGPPVAKPQPEANPFQPKAGTLVYLAQIGETQVGILAADIALLKTLKPKRKKLYIKSSQIPLKDLCGFFRSLSSQLQGSLSSLKESQLKRLALPLIVPQGMGLPPIPDEEATCLLILSHEQRHGVVLCRQVEGEARELLSFSRAKNGDIAGLARFADEVELPLLNVGQFLEREGFLSLPG